MAVARAYGATFAEEKRLIIEHVTSPDVVNSKRSSAQRQACCIELNNASAEVRDDWETMLALSHVRDPTSIASERLMKTKDFALEAVNIDGAIINHLDRALQRDPDIVRAAMRTYGGAMRLANSGLRSEKEVVLAAVKNHGLALEYASVELCDDRELVLIAVKSSGHALEYASETLQGDAEVVLAAVRSEGFALQHASEELRSDPTIVLVAVQQEGTALELASDEFRSDRQLVLAALKADGRALQHASAEFRSDKDVVLVAVDSHGFALEYASRELRNDADVVHCAVKRHGDVLGYAGKECRMNRDIVLDAVRTCGKAIGHASEELRKDREIALLAVEQDASAFGGLSEELRSDREVIIKALHQAEEKGRRGLMPSPPHVWSLVSDAIKLDKDAVLWVLRDFEERTARALHKQATESLDEELLWEDFQGARLSSLALPGESFPVLTVSLTEAATSSSKFYDCAVTLMSGNGFSCRVPSSNCDLPRDEHPSEQPQVSDGVSEETSSSLDAVTANMPSTLGDLAKILLVELSKHMKAPIHERVFMHIMKSDSEGDCYIARPWDWNKPLASITIASNPCI